MGCTQSKIENEEAVARCKERKHNMKEAVSARNAFAAAHSSYATYVKNTGATLSDFAHCEVQNPQLATPGLPPQSFVIAPPPPPLPPPLQRAATMPEIKLIKSESTPVGPILEEDEENELENEGSGSLRRRSSRKGGGSSRIGTNQEVEMEEEAARPPMPPPPQSNLTETQLERETHDHPMSHPQNDPWEYFFLPMENMTARNLSVEEEPSSSFDRDVEFERKAFDEKPNRRVADVDHEDKRSGKHEVPEPIPMPEKVMEPPLPPAAMAAMAGNGPKKVKQGAVPIEGKRIVKQNVNMVQIFTELDEDFLKASESAREVSKMLEATRLHYHSNFADNRGHIDHSARVMRVITWNRSFKRAVPNLDDEKEDYDSDEHETHATVLDKLLAWEKKLYDEVKAGELMKFEYQKKVSMLNKLKKRSNNSEALEKAKAAVSHLHTRYIVDMQSMDSTVSEINRLRDEQLYPRLVQLVDGMATMWRTMQDHHERQSKIVVLLRNLDISQSPKETSEHHHDRTHQLLLVAKEWLLQFEKLITNQRGYIKALNTWLKLNLIPIESSLKEKVSSPPRVKIPPIQGLVNAWHDHLEKLPDEVAKTAISNFAALIDTIFRHQQDEINLKRKCEDTQKELARKTRQFDDWYHKYMEKKIPAEVDPDRAEGNNAPDEIVTEKQFLVEQLKKKLEEEEEAYTRQCLQVRQKSLVTLKNRLPELFIAMSDFAHECFKMYAELQTI